MNENKVSCKKCLEPCVYGSDFCELHQTPNTILYLGYRLKLAENKVAAMCDDAELGKVFREAVESGSFDSHD